MGIFKSESSSKPVDLTPQEFKNIRPFVAGQIQELSGGGPQFGGPFTAPIGAQEQTALNRTQQAAIPGELGAASDEFLMNLISGQSTPGLIEAAIRPIQQNFDDNELLRRALFARSGQKIQESSPFALAQSKAIGGVSDAIGDVTARIGFEQQARQLQAVQQAQANASARFETSVGALEAAGLPRMIEQFGVTEGKKEFDRRMAMMRDVLQIGVQATQATVASEQSSEGGVFDLGANFDFKRG